MIIDLRLIKYTILKIKNIIKDLKNCKTKKIKIKY